MGDRYYLSVRCQECGVTDDDVYYAPTCGFTKHICTDCGYETDLGSYSGISYEDCSNVDLVKELLK
jgi:hypothetical protein